jgi:hypothetical protein
LPDPGSDVEGESGAGDTCDRQKVKKQASQNGRGMIRQEKDGFWFAPDSSKVQIRVFCLFLTRTTRSKDWRTKVPRYMVKRTREETIIFGVEESKQQDMDGSTC